MWVSLAESFSWVKKKINNEEVRIRDAIMSYYKKLLFSRKKGEGQKVHLFEGLQLISVLTEQCLNVLLPHLVIEYLINWLQQ